MTGRKVLIAASGVLLLGLLTLFTALQDQGWRERLGGSTARDFAGGGAPETLEPLYCKDGCVGLFRYQADGFELAWFDR